VLAQLVLLGLFVFAVAKTFWPKRSVTLPTMAPDANGAAALVAEVARLRAESATLAARVSSIEALLGRADETPRL